MYSYLAHTAPLLENAGARAEPAAKALATLCRNIIEKPSNMKYRRVPCVGTAFKSRVADCPGALTVLSHVRVLPRLNAAHHFLRYPLHAFTVPFFCALCTAQLGFCKVSYPDQEYYVLHKVDAALISGVLRELEIFLATAEKLRASRAGSSCTASSAAAGPSADEARSADGELLADGHGLEDDEHEDDMTLLPVRGDVMRSDPAMDGTAIPVGTSVAHFGDNIQRQLAARAIVHRVAASQQQRDAGVRRRRDWILVLAVAAAASAAGAWLMSNS